MNDIPPPIPPNSVRLFDRLRADIRTRGLSYATEKTYLSWIRRFILFHNKRHPKDRAEPDVEQFLRHLAINRNVAVNTQKTALNALVFLYRSQTINKPLGQFNLTTARVPRRIPTVFTRDEAQAVIGYLEGVHQLIAKLMYGAGLRLNEALRLRVGEVDFQQNMIIVRSGKNNKDRRTLLPESYCSPLLTQRKYVHALHLRDMEAGINWVYLPNALARKYPKAAITSSTALYRSR